MDVRESPIDGFLEVGAVATHALEVRKHLPELVEVGCKERAGAVHGAEVV